MPHLPGMRVSSTSKSGKGYFSRSVYGVSPVRYAMTPSPLVKFINHLSCGAIFCDGPFEEKTVHFRIIRDQYVKKLCTHDYAGEFC